MEILTHINSPEEIDAETAAIREAVLRQSRFIHEANFARIGAEDIELIFDLYDGRFFDRWIRRTLETNKSRLSFRVSPMMTRAGGKTILRSYHDGRLREYEIAIASRLLFMTFGDVQRPVTVSGLACQDRLQSLQRIMEHEIIHLVELLAWGKSSCSKARFKGLAANFFGHRGIKHDLVTAREHAALQHGVRLGDKVQFEYAGRCLAGRVNRIGQRATILVSDSHGQRYSDGGTYAKFYVPLGLLKAAATR